MAFGNSIIARLGLDSRDFRAGIASARAALGGFTTGAIGTVISGAAIKSVTEYGDLIQDLSERYNVNAVALQRLGGVAEKEGSSLDGVARAYDKLIKNSDAALQGNQEMIKSFTDLGITVDDLRSLSPEQIMLKIGQGSMQASDLVKVLGKSALELRPTLSKLAAGTAEFSDAIDEINIQRLAEANDALKDIQATVRVYAADILVQIGEGFKVLRNDGRTLAEDTKNVWSAAAGIIGNIFKGNLRGASIEIRNLAEAEKKMLKDLYFAKDEAVGDAAARAGLGTAAGAAADVGGLKPKTRAELSAEQKERERNQLSLAELQEGPTVADLNRASPQAVYAADQARQIKELEAQAFHLRQYQQDFTGSQKLLDRADTMRSGLGQYGLKESEMAMAVRTGFDSSAVAQDINRKLDGAWEND